LAVVSSKVSNSAAQVIGSGTWSVFPGSNLSFSPSLIPNGTAYSSTTSTSSTCSSITRTSTTAIASKTLTLNDVTNLVIGMAVTWPGGSNEISSINVGTSQITLKTGNPSAMSGTIFTFTVAGCFSSFFSINNNGSTDILTISITQTTNVSGGATMKFQSCNVSGVGSANIAWNETTNTCPGTVNTILTTVGSGSGTNTPQIATQFSLPIQAQTLIRLRALATSSGANYTVSLTVDRNSIRIANSLSS
jgi:hypothetical protein